jgi:asparagine synthase (glutamine-hydrolysing)
MMDILSILRKKLEMAVGEIGFSGLLFSGGLDSSILAWLNRNIVALTATLESEGEDILYADFLERKLGLKHFYKIVYVDEAIDSIPEVIKILKSFDPALPNDLVVYFSLKMGKEKGIARVMTGDGADELFAGYDFMKELFDPEGYIERIARSMAFSSNLIGDSLGIEIIQPYLNKEFVEFSLSIPIHLKIRKDGGKVWGKWILRKAFEDLLPSETIWQEKRPLEQGSGMTRLRKIISDLVSDEDFEMGKRESQVKFINKEHFYYYRIYQNVVGKIPEPQGDEKRCPGCGAGMKIKSYHCRVCGWVEAIL